LGDCQAPGARREDEQDGRAEGDTVPRLRQEQCNEAQTLTGLDYAGLVHGELHSIEPTDDGFRLQYSHPNGRLYQGNSIEWLASLEEASVDLVFADPPYNINKADWDSFDSQEAYIAWSIQWIEQAARVLKTSGSMYVCGFSEILADLKHPASRYFGSCRWLVWHYKNKANLGRDWGRSHESVLHLRKSKIFKLNVDQVRIPYGSHTLRYPAHPQAVSSNFDRGQVRDHWTPNPLGAKPKDVLEIPTTCNGSGESTEHPTQKPEELIRKFVLAASAPGERVVDPFSGSGTTLVVAEQLGRRWAGCEMSAEYNRWAVDRVEHVARRTVDEWIEFDRANAQRRNSIR
jgi:site-specific DNA-methyltransferase (adenine-specific)